MDSSKDDGGELGRLMHDFRVKEAKEMQAGALKDRVYELKETEKGVEHISKKYDIFEVSKRIGHKSVKTTQDIYGHLFDDVQKSIANDLNMIRRGGV